jgi:small subunit ribosomal protein S6
MRRYELMLILPAEADDKAIEGVIERIRQSIAPSGGEVGKTDRWGRRRLAYEINRMSEGYYLIVEFTADPGHVRELERVLTLADEVVRFKTIVLPEKRVTTSAQSTRATASTPAAAEPPAEERSEPETPAEADEQDEPATTGAA